jgi:hypothetical protein
MIEGQFEAVEDRIKKDDELIRSVHYRNPLQIIVFGMLGIKTGDVEGVLKYSPIIKRIIEDASYAEIRGHIIDKHFQIAAELVVAEIKSQSLDQQIKLAA